MSLLFSEPNAFTIAFVSLGTNSLFGVLTDLEKLKYLVATALSRSRRD